MPFCHARLHAKKPLPSKYPKELGSLGDHIRKRRLDLGLLQREVADEIGVDEATIHLWERNATRPPARYLPRVIKFLGYEPWPAPQTLPEQLLAARRALGLTQRQMAQKLGVDSVTLGMWKRGNRRPLKWAMARIEGLLAHVAYRKNKPGAS